MAWVYIRLDLERTLNLCYLEECFCRRKLPWVDAEVLSFSPYLLLRSLAIPGAEPLLSA